MQVEERPLEALDEGVEDRAAGWDPVLPDVRRPAGIAEGLAELRPLVGRRHDEPESRCLTRPHDVLEQQAG
jgi:hypothetical protein